MFEILGLVFEKLKCNKLLKLILTSITEIKLILTSYNDGHSSFRFVLVLVIGFQVIGVRCFRPVYEPHFSDQISQGNVGLESGFYHR